MPTDITTIPLEELKKDLSDSVALPPGARGLKPGNERLVYNGFELNPFAVALWNSIDVVIEASGRKSVLTTSIQIPQSSVAWGDWRMVLEGVEYAPLWKNAEEHARHYGGL